MGKLEHYLDQVCRGLAGPKSMRTHVKQELREHILDAVAGHEQEGMTHDEALSRALDDFGGPAEVRSELEATHGHRVTTLIIDKALQWKEMTMKSKWLWTTWAHVAVVLVLFVELLAIVGTTIVVIPKFNELTRREWIYAGGEIEPVVAKCLWMVSKVESAVDAWAIWLVGAVVVIGLFEWRVRSENKSMIRLSLLGTAAAKIALTGAAFWVSMILTLIVGMHHSQYMPPEPDVRRQVLDFTTSLAALEAAVAEKDWNVAERLNRDAHRAVSALTQIGAAAPVLRSLPNQEANDELRRELAMAAMSWDELSNALDRRYEPRIDEAMKRYRELGKRLNAAAQPAK